MKSLLILSAFITVHAYAAFDVCKLEDTVAFEEAVEAKQVRKLKEVNDHQKWTAQEKKMIHETIKSDGYSQKLNQFEALRQFGDYYDEGDKETGPNAGYIDYYQTGSKKFALVHYWPGDNEVGAFVEILKSGKIKIIATVSDQWIECKR